jgi:hypothetical protein
MPQAIRIVDGFRTQANEQIATAAGTIITGLTNNPAFPFPPVDPNTVQAAIDDLNAALAAQPHGGTTATAEKNSKRAVLVEFLRKLKHYVQDNCRNDPAVALSSGFPSAASTRMRSPLANPSILNVRLGNSAELVLKATPIARAKCYEVQLAALGASNAPGPWQIAGLFTDSRLMAVNGLTPGTTYMF